MSIYSASVSLKKAAASLRYGSYPAFSKREGFTITAHAGAMHTRHNSLWSVREAIAAAPDIIELDITRRRSGAFVMLHKPLAENTQGETLEKVFSLIRSAPELGVNLDLKNFTGLDMLQKMLFDSDIADRAFFTGVSAENVPAVKSGAPNIPYYLNASADVSRFDNIAYCREFAAEIAKTGAVGLNTNYKAVSRTLIAASHEIGLSVSVWTVNSKADFERMLSYGADNITTMKPLELKLMTRG